ncbi:MAG: 30S ribosomal protein S17 [Steroidobacteraceae bacterium]
MSTKKTAAKSAAKKAAAKKPAAETSAAPAAAAPAATPKAAKQLTGKVVSSKMEKTIAVSVERYVPHATYGKYQRRRTKLLAHDENNEGKEGDVVAIEQCRPLSRHKSWRLVKVISRNVQLDQVEETTP